jgi:1-aminocyclopropane-1-carboxylate deaminase
MSLDLESRFPRRRLGFWPSPIHPLPRLSKEIGIEVWAKRDDVASGLAFGGNKIRKLEWLAAEALAQGCDTLVSIGNTQSNHTRQVAAVAATLGLKCRLVQEEWTKWNDTVYDKVGNILLSRLMGAVTVMEGEGYSTAVKETWTRVLEQVRREGGKPYAIPAGASDHPLGGLGYAHFADELAAQEGERDFFRFRDYRDLHRLHPGGHGGRVQRARPQAPVDRHRYGGKCRHDPCRGDQDRARDRCADRRQPRDPG